MSGDVRGALQLVQDQARQLVQGVILIFALGHLAASLAVGLGALPLPEIALFFGGQPVPDAGMWAQLALTGLALALTLYLPANARMARLERSHHSFAMGMEDVARAYRLAHEADRKGAFALSGEFDAMRARLDHLRRHPDLAHLEPELLQLAAQMSFETRELARTYSVEKVNRARTFLAQRQEEVQALTDRLAAARRVCDDLRRWLQDIEADERQAQTQLAVLRPT